MCSERNEQGQKLYVKWYTSMLPVFKPECQRVTRLLKGVSWALISRDAQLNLHVQGWGHWGPRMLPRLSSSETKHGFLDACIVFKRIQGL